MPADTETSTWKRYLAWRRSKKVPLGPDSFLIGLAVMIPLAVVLGIFGPDGEGAGAVVLRSALIGLAVGALVTVLMWRERRQRHGTPPG